MDVHFSNGYRFVFCFPCGEVGQHNDNEVIGVPLLAILYFVFDFVGAGGRRVALCAAPP